MMVPSQATKHLFTCLLDAAGITTLIVCAGADASDALLDANEAMHGSRASALPYICFTGVTLPAATGGGRWVNLSPLATKAARELDRELATAQMIDDWSQCGTEAWVADVEGDDSARTVSISFEDGRWWVSDSAADGSDAFLLLTQALDAGNDVLRCARRVTEAARALDAAESE